MKNPKLKIAIFHDYMDSIGGGEKLALDLAKGLDADIYTTVINHDNLKRINTGNVKVNLLGKCTSFPILKQVNSSILFYNADLQSKGYDYYIMSGNWSIFACRRHHPNLHYVHTPPRMFYDSKDFFYKTAPWYAKWPFLAWVAIHKYFYEKQLKNADRFIANSSNVKGRIKKYYGKDSNVIYPPVRHYKFRKYEDYWLCVSRIYPHKRIELILEAFSKMPSEKLILVGGYMEGDNAKMYARKVLKNIPANVEYRREVTEEKLARLYGECKGFITMSKDEDFGMTVVEAMSAGKAVIASDEGGHRETVMNGKTGYLTRPRIDDLIASVKKVSKDPSRFGKDCMSHAARFGVERFIRQIKTQIGVRSR